MMRNHMQKQTSFRTVRAALPAAVLAAGLMTMAPTIAGENMNGRQSQNEGIQVLPAPAAGVKVDGDLSEWDWSGRIQVFAEYSLRDRFSAETAAMWDKDALYVAVKWRDNTPMNSTVDPKITPGDGWKADALQLRVNTSDQTSWMTTWFFSGRGEPVLDITKWKDKGDPRQGFDSNLFIGENGKTRLGEGVELAYKKDADGKGYVQELRIPWSQIYRQPPEITAGNALRIGMEFLWADPSGKIWPIHRYADNMQPGKTSREFFWTTVANWGNAELVAQGNVTPRVYTPSIEKMTGSVPVKVEIPADAKAFTIVIEDAAGARVRNLIGDGDPEIYGTGVKDGKRTVEVLWDGLNDDGKPVEPGSYKIRGLTRGALSAEYEMCFYNPGTPPWLTQDGGSGWGADHAPPRGVVAAGDRVIVHWYMAEGGHGIIGIGPDGRKLWGEKRGAGHAAADTEFLYTFSPWTWSGENLLFRYALADGDAKPFVLDGQERPFELPLKEVLGDLFDEALSVVKASPTKHRGYGYDPVGLDVVLQVVNGMALKSGVLALSLANNQIALLDPTSAKLLKTIPANKPTALAFDPQGQLFAVLDGQVQRVDLDSGVATAAPTPGVGKASAITFDQQGNLLVADIGPDSQVKAFGPDGKLAYTCGKKGGRPIRGAFDEQAMMRMSAVAVDAKGQVWVTEHWDFPRRVSVWGKDGKLVRDYIGGSKYSGSGTYLHDQNPDLAYSDSVEMRLDRKTRSWKVTKVLWVPDASKGERFFVEKAHRFRKVVGGVPHEYLYSHHEYGSQVLFMEFPDGWRPVAAVCTIGKMLGLDADRVPSAMPAGEWAGLDPADVCFWNDTNRDGIPQRSECVIVPATNKSEVGKNYHANIPLRLNNGWGGRIGPDFSIYAGSLEKGVVRYKPLRMSQDGVPFYGPEGMEELGVKAIGDMIPSGDGKSLVCIGANHGGPILPFLSLTLADKKIEWSYPNLYPGVHGSHRAPMPKPGLLLGPLKVCGVADMGKEIGEVLFIRGNLGQNFLFTRDGLFVAAMMQDNRLPWEPLPDREELLVGVPMETRSEGGEPFNGWFGRQDDGKVRQSSGQAGQAGMSMEIKGLETIRRFEAGALTLDEAALAKALADNAERLAAAAKAKPLLLRSLSTPPTLQGAAKEWENIPGVKVLREGTGEQAEVKLAYDQQNLYVSFDVADQSPWLNAGKEHAFLFKTGDAVDIQLSTKPAAKPGNEAAEGDLRIVIAPLGGKPTAVLMAQVDPKAKSELRQTYTSPVMTKTFDRVEVLASARVAVKKTDLGYLLEAAIPLVDIGLKPEPGMKLRGDVGFISSDGNGMINTARTYLFNKKTGLVSDLPGEARLTPAEWGEIKVQ
jgi:sugar lactone lactonase YvrE